ncbi:MAG TPA: SulP family inorganic anion transporter [Burkholderiales bacterium]|nr:SulP family inorganic anion transporter [Burkholderiales bacterium]
MLDVNGRPGHRFRPRLFDAVRGYGAAALRSDLLAGITVGIVALPLAMAFAIASGLKPEAGLVTAVIAGFLISLLGGSRVQIGGPAGAFIVVVYGIVQQHGLLNLAISTIMAGLLLLLMGLTRVGSLVRYVPVAIVIGFTNGIAVLIALSQVRDLLGLRLASLPADFFGQIVALWTHAGTLNPVAFALAAACFGVLLLWPRLRLPVPGAIVVLVVATAATARFGLPVETIGSRFGGIPSGLPAFAPPEWSWANARTLVGPALTIALLGAIESLLCARVADAVIHDRHDPNQELMAQGVANIVAPMFGGMPATGTIARTMTNIRAGARTPVAGMAHALTVLAVMLAAAPLAHHVPLAALAAILLNVALNMGEWRAFTHLRRYSPHYRTILLATFTLTVVVDLTVAVEIGLVLAGLFFILRVSALTTIDRVAAAPDGSPLPDGVAAYKLQGSLFFATVGKLDELSRRVPGQAAPRAVVLDLHYVMNMDTTAIDALQTLHASLDREGTLLVLCAPQAQPLSLIKRSGFFERLGAENVQRDLAAGIERAAALRGR